MAKRDKKQEGEKAKKSSAKAESKVSDLHESARRPGSAVSQQFLPKKQQNATNLWQKQNEEQKNPVYGYVPFKSTPLPIYNIRSGSAAGNVQRTSNPNIVNVGAGRKQFPSSVCSQPQSVRADSAMSINGLRFDSRPGSELGLYKSPSRYQSYSTLPRPDNIDIEDFRPSYPQPGTQHEIYGSANGTKIIYGAAALPQKVCAQPPGNTRFASSFSAPYDAYPVPLPPPPPPMDLSTPIGAQIADEINRLGMKPIVNWEILSLSSYLQIVFGLGLIGIGLARLFLRFDYAKGHELFYGISVLLAGVISLFAARQRCYSLAVISFVHSIINTLFFFLPFFSGILPLLANEQFGLGAKTNAANNNNGIVNAQNTFEMNMTFSVLSLLEFMTALTASIYGCKAGGALILHVEGQRLAQFSNSSLTAVTYPINAPRPYFRSESVMKKEML